MIDKEIDKLIAEKGTPRKPDIIVVDDDELVLKLLTRHLTNWGYHIQTATSGDEAGRLLETSDPFLLLSDKNMSGGDGYSLLKTFRKHKQSHPWCLFVMMSGDTATDQHVRSLDTGAHDYLEKPFRNIRDWLKSKVIKYLELSTQIRKSESLILQLSTEKQANQSLIFEMSEKEKMLIQIISDLEKNLELDSDSLNNSIQELKKITDSFRAIISPK